MDNHRDADSDFSADMEVNQDISSEILSFGQNSPFDSESTSIIDCNVEIKPDIATLMKYNEKSNSPTPSPLYKMLSYEEVEVLIKFVQWCPVLWEASHPRRTDRAFVCEQWAIIANNLGISAIAARKKFKNLRDQFRIELKKTPEGRAGDITLPLEEYNTKWPFFEMLFFLKDTMLGRKTYNRYSHSVLRRRNTKRTYTRPVSRLSHSKQSALASIESSLREDKNLPQNMQNGEGPDSSCKEKQTLEKPNKEINGAPSSSNTNNKLVQNLLNIETEKLKLIQNCNEEDAEQHFLLSLVPSMKNMSKKNQCLFRIKVQELIYKYLYEEEEPLHS